MFLVVTRNFPPELGGMQNLMEGLSNALLDHGPVKVFAEATSEAEIYDQNSNLNEKKNVILKTLGFTFLNPHVYSDTVFFLGNFSKSFLLIEKYFFGVGAAIASFLFFFSIGYLSQYFARYLNDKKIWKYINIFIILFMFLITLYISRDILKFYNTSII